MTAFADYIDLRLAVGDQVRRRDISDVIRMKTLAAEAWFNKELRHREMIVPAVLAFSAGVAALPADFIETVTLWDTNGSPITVTEKQVAAPTRLGAAIITNNIYLNGVSGNRDFDYYAKLPTLTTSPTTSNWLLQRSPNAYLYAVSYEVAKWMRDVEMAAAMKELRGEEMRDLRRDDVRARWGEGTVRLRGCAP